MKKELTTELVTEYPDQSKVWLYQADRALTEDERKFIDLKLAEFVEEWAAHGNKLYGVGKTVNPYFIMIAVNDTLAPPSGCSVDASVHFLKELGATLKVDLFTRMRVTIEEEEEIKQINFSDLENHKDALIYDPLITSVGDFKQGWPRPIASSNFAQAV